MKILYNLILLNFYLPTFVLSQTANSVINSLNVKVPNSFVASLNDYENGSAFSIVVFNLDSVGKFTKLSVTSTNSLSKRIIDNLLDEKSNWFEFIDPKVGNFAIPIIQVMVNDEKGGLNWKNNTSWEMAKFAKHLNLPEHTILLNPIFTMGTKPIIN